jgi:hypothetical protein
MDIEILKEHSWLHKLLGDWTHEAEMIMEPGQPPLKSSGTESVRSLGGLWVVCEGVGKMPESEQTHQSIMTLGYDPAKKKFVGTFVTSCMTHLWPYEGSLDAAERVLTLDSIGPSFAGDGTMGKYQDIIEIVSDSERLLKSQIQRPDGSWMQFMTAKYRRR